MFEGSDTRLSEGTIWHKNKAEIEPVFTIQSGDGTGLYSATFVKSQF